MLISKVVRKQRKTEYMGSRRFGVKYAIILVSLLLMLFHFPYTLNAQQSDSLKYKPLPVLKLSGPRIGVTFITGKLADTLRTKYGAAPIITQFGWQLEKRFIATESGLSGLTEFVPLIGGLEQGLFLPSLSFLIGLRTAKGSEFGVGPNISLGGFAYVLAAGVTKNYGGLNFPINASLVMTKKGLRISLLIGFNSVN